MDGADWIDEQLRELARAAAGGGISDLVLEPRDDERAELVLRRDGVRAVFAQCPPAFRRQVIGRLKALAGVPGYITDEAQDGRIDGAPFGFAGDLRMAVLPTVRGERIAIRLPALGPLPEPERLGLPTVALSAMRALLRRPDGMVLVSGPTGSGKTTTIHSLLRELAAQRSDRVLLTIEDPVERRVPGLVQCEVRTAIDFTPDAALRAALRQDADVIVIGEIRDRATAEAALRAALAGHLIVATVHAPRARDVIPRLLEMGVAGDLLFPVLRAVLAQRLLRSVHQDCGGAGCAVCNGGFAGRLPVADLLVCEDQSLHNVHDWSSLPLTCDMDAQAAELVNDRRSTAAEAERVLGG